MPRRKRKNIKREPNGRASRAEAKREQERFARWQRRHLVDEVGAENVMDPRAIDVIGKLELKGVLIKEQCDGLREYRNRYLTYKRVKGLPAPLPQGPGTAYLAFGGRGEIDNPEYVRVVTERLEEARTICRNCGLDVALRVRMVCEDDKEALLRWLPLLAQAGDALYVSLIGKPSRFKRA